MPTIIVQAENDQGHPTAVTLSERIVPAEVLSQHYLAQLVERVGWAVRDAEGLERTLAPAGQEA
jgi:hypothetical protein